LTAEPMTLQSLSDPVYAPIRLTIFLLHCIYCKYYCVVLGCMYVCTYNVLCQSSHWLP